MSTALELAIIFVAQVTYVSISTLRWVILMRGGRKLASAISFFEILIYVYALSLVVTRLTEPIALVIYALGYTVGAFVGSYIEGKLALGFAIIQMVTRADSDLEARLRQRGYGVTSWPGKGRDADRTVSLVLCRRRHVSQLYLAIHELDPSAFLVELEPRSLKGGFWAKRLRTANTIAPN